MISDVDIRDWGREPVRPIESKEQYEHYLRTHDWFFDFSEDYRVWKQGFSARAYLVEAQKLFDPEGKLWNRYAKK